MNNIEIPPELGITYDENMPIIDLAVALANKGYTLENQGDGTLKAIPLKEAKVVNMYRPPLCLDDAMPCCGQKRMHCNCASHHIDIDY